MLRLIESSHIDKNKWDEVVKHSSIQNPLIYTWSLGATASKWCAIVNEDYSFMLPITYREQFGLKRAKQPEYSRQMDFIGSQSNLTKAIQLAKNHFKEFDIRISKNELGVTDVSFQMLDLTSAYKYSTNANRLIKKADEYYQYTESVNYSDLLELYQRNSFLKFKQDENNLISLSRLIDSLDKNGMIKIYNAMSDKKVVGSMCVIVDKKTTYYLIGDADQEQKKNGVIFGLMNYAIENAKNEGYDKFDFGGSNVKSVATFYKKFGASNQDYSRLNWDNLPFWFKALKRLKK